ncbi:hypothetical protein [Demequina sp.]|uniref:hypothetical protein n=1 Tax=Demequina sp. TaxID=2050685 RepID=UPI003D0B42B5
MSGLSRRNVVIGAAWATPAILVATSVPAAAASPPVAGLIALSDVSANLVTGTLTVSARVAYVGDGGASADLPVSNVFVSIVIPTDRLGSNPSPVPAGIYWRFISSAVEGSNTVFGFQYMEGVGELTAASSPTAALSVQFNRAGDFTNFPVTVRGDGVSNEAPVPTVTQIVTTSTGATIVFNVTPPMQAQANYQGQGPAYVFYGATRWNGPYYPVGASVSNIRVISRVPEANGTGAIYPPTPPAGWVRTGPVLSSGYWTVLHEWSGTIGNSNQTTPELRFALIAAQTPPVLNVGFIRTEGTTSEGALVFAEYSGPTALSANDAPPPPLTPYGPGYPG